MAGAFPVHSHFVSCNRLVGQDSSEGFEWVQDLNEQARYAFWPTPLFLKHMNSAQFKLGAVIFSTIYLSQTSPKSPCVLFYRLDMRLDQPILSIFSSIYDIGFI